MKENDNIKIGIVLEKVFESLFQYFIIQDTKTSERKKFYINPFDVLPSSYETIVLYDVVEYETEGDEIKRIERKYNLLLDEIMRR